MHIYLGRFKKFVNQNLVYSLNALPNHSVETFYFHLYTLYVALPHKKKQEIEFSSFCIKKK